jgi:polyphosphate glucokinase
MHEPERRAVQKTDKIRTLAVDIGGTGIKLALLDGDGKMIGERVRVPTPPPPVAPEIVTDLIDRAAAPLGDFDRVSVGFPGMIRHGRVLTAPNLGTELWAGCDLQTVLSSRWGKPVRVMNDADMQGLGAIKGTGVEMVVTLGTGCGTAIFDDGKAIPHLELSHHPLRRGLTYDQYLGRTALDRIGRKKWNRRVARAIDVLRIVVAFDHLYLGGGNAKHIRLDLPDDVSIVPNSFGLTGGFALWRDIEGRKGDMARQTPAARLPDRGGKTAASTGGGSA